MSRLISEMARPTGLRCEFDEGWYRGQCPHLTPEGPFCRQHAGEICKGCGQQATYWCGHATSFSCGAPRCDTCDCPSRGTDGAPGSHGWKWGRREQNAMTADEERARRSTPPPVDPEPSEPTSPPVDNLWTPEQRRAAHKAWLDSFGFSPDDWMRIRMLALDVTESYSPPALTDLSVPIAVSAGKMNPRYSARKLGVITQPGGLVVALTWWKLGHDGTALWTRKP